MKNKKIITKSAAQTKKLGKSLAREIIKLPLGKTAVVLGLYGNLGGGKTTFVQGFAEGLGIREKILSPTFVIMKRFEISKKEKSAPNMKCPIGHFMHKNFYHIDCYRLRGEKDILSLDFKKIISDPKNIVTIEWPGIIEKALPKNAIMLYFEVLEEKKREIILKNML